MRKTARAALLAACFVTAPAASAGDFFLDGQLGRADLGSGFGNDRSDLVQASAGYRWGIGNAQLGLEAGLARLDGADARSRGSDAGGVVDRGYSLSARQGFAGANARFKPPLVPVYFIGRAGVLAARQTLEETAVEQSGITAPVTRRTRFDRTSGGTYAGVGVGTTLLPLLDVGLVLTRYRTAQVQYDPVRGEYRLSDDKRDAHSLSLAVEYRF